VLVVNIWLPIIPTLQLPALEQLAMLVVAVTVLVIQTVHGVALKMDLEEGHVIMLTRLLPVNDTTVLTSLHATIVWVAWTA